MHSQACHLSYQISHIHISLPWCSHPKRNWKMEPFTHFIYSSFFLPHFLLTLTYYCTSSSSSSFAPHILLLLSGRFLTLNLSFTSLFLVSPHHAPPSDFNSSLSSLCSSLTPSGERPIRLHRGFTGHGCGGKPKWNAAHLLE